MSESADVVYSEMNKLRKNELIDLLINGSLPGNVTSEVLISFVNKMKNETTSDESPEVDKSAGIKREEKSGNILKIEVKYMSELLIQKDQVIANQAIAIEALQNQIKLMNHSPKSDDINTPKDINSRQKVKSQQRNGNSHVKNTDHSQIDKIEINEERNSVSGVSYASKITDKKNINMNTNSQLISVSNESGHSAKKSEILEKNEWEKVTYKKPKRHSNRTLVVGEFSSANVQGIEKMKTLHVTNLRPDVKKEDFQSFLLQKFSANVKCEPLNSRFPEAYSSFKVTIPISDYDKALIPSNWPNHASVRNFFRSKKAVTRQSSITVTEQ